MKIITNLSGVRGFTLVEVMVCVAITVIIFSGIYMVLHTANVNWFIDMGMLDLQQSARLAMDGMTRELRQGDSSGVSITNGGEKVDFSIPNVDGTLSYYLEGNQIIREYPAGTEKPIAQDVTALNFSINADTVTVELGLGKTALNRDLSFSLSEKVRMRNE